MADALAPVAVTTGVGCSLLAAARFAVISARSLPMMQR